MSEPAESEKLPEAAAEDATPEPVSDEEPITSPGIDAPSVSEADESPPAPKYVIAHGWYHGPGCPDPNARHYESDKGFHYDAHHPGRPGEPVIGLPPWTAERLLKAGTIKRVH